MSKLVFAEPVARFTVVYQGRTDREPLLNSW